MVAYEFYRGGPKEGYQLIGVLPERRSDSERINDESIMNWVRGLLGDQGKGEDLFFIQVEVDEKTIRDS